MGHSLGGVIFFDLLNSQQALSFRPKSLVMLGSPTALFLHCSQTQIEDLPAFLKDVALWRGECEVHSFR